MLRKNDGYFLAEMILSLAAFVMAVSILLPLAIHVKDQMAQTRKVSEASHILFDELMHLKITGVATGKGDVYLNGTVYQIVISKSNEDGESSREVCVQYENGHLQAKRCANTE
ncbi:hypothetical protein [Mesobacillus subterraneus]|uniref:Type II secretion system protein n=1 Tax=Mesobacillus subterraneus TaxID=285983 RepID=A0A427TSV5_9BACI|nr:hypothetical protein [Mesobacillus subterraneus]RSD27423.1 hypothetical protein EJA10_10100 [Mesobacillus subterraneus]